MNIVMNDLDDLRKWSELAGSDVFNPVDLGDLQRQVRILFEEHDAAWEANEESAKSLAYVKQFLDEYDTEGKLHPSLHAAVERGMRATS